MAGDGSGVDENSKTRRPPRRGGSRSSLLRVEARNAPAGPGTVGRTMGDMVESMIEVSVGVPAELWAKVETAAEEDCASVSAVLTEALAQHLARRARLRSVSAWALDAAAGSEVDGLAEADAMQDVTGCA